MPAVNNNTSSSNNYPGTDMDNPEATLDPSNTNNTNDAGVQIDVPPSLYPVDGIDASAEGATEPSSAKVNSESINAKDGNINLQYENEQGTAVDVEIGKDKVSFSQSVPGYDEAVTQEIRYADLEASSPEQLKKMDELNRALQGTQGSDIGGEEGRLLEKSKARIETLQDPRFWQQVNERAIENKEKVVDLFNGEQAIVTKEFDLVNYRDNLYELTGDDGYTTQNITLTGDGTNAEFGKKKDTLKPLYMGADGQLKVVFGHEKYDEATAQDNAIAEVMSEQIQGSGLRALPIEQENGYTQLNSLQAGEGFSYDRSGGASDHVRMGNNGLNITTTIPDETSDESKTVDTELKYADINNWSRSARAMFDDVHNAMSSVDRSQLTEEQQDQHNQIMAKLGAVDDPLFWNSVNTEVAEQINGEVNGEPAVINEESRLIETVNANNGEKTFFIDRGEGREEVTINDDESVTLGDEKLPVRLDQASGVFYVVTDHESGQDLMTRTVGQHMKVRGEQANISQSNPLMAMAQMPNHLVSQVNNGQVTNTNQYNQEQVEEYYQQYMADPALRDPLLEESLNDPALTTDLEY